MPKSTGAGLVLMRNFSGLINSKCHAFVGSGCVIHIPSLFNELDTLE